MKIQTLIVVTLLLLGKVTLAQETLVTTAFAAQEVSQLIEEAKNSASTLLGEAEVRGSALLNQAGNELNVLAMNVTSLLGNQLDKTVSELTTENQQLLVRLDRMTNSTEKFLNRDIYDIKDAVALDLTQALSGIPLYQDKLFISRISGLTHIASENGYYSINIIGTNLGIGDDRVTSTIKISIDSIVVNDFILERTTRNESIIKIPIEHLNDSSNFSKKELILDVEFKVKKKFLFIIPYSKTKAFTVPISITILPLRAGNLSVSYTSAKYCWQRERTEFIDKSTANHDCRRSNCRGEPTRTGYSISYRVNRSNTNPPTPGDRRLVDLRLICLAGPCEGWNAVMSRTISDNQTLAVARFDVWSHPTTWRMTVDVHQYQETNEVQTKEVFELNYNEIIKIETPNNLKYGTLKLTTISNETIEVLLGKEDENGLLKLHQTQNLSNSRKIYFYSVRKPI